VSFARYPKYKASGVEWLGDVPEHWEVKPLRSVFKFSKGLTITKEDLLDEGVQCVNYGEIHSKYGFRLNPLVHPLRSVARAFLVSNADAVVCSGDFIFADTSEDLAGCGNFTHLSTDDQIFAGYHTIIGRPRLGNIPLFLAYHLHSQAFRSQIHKQAKGIKVYSITQSLLKAAKCLLPPLPEQRAIAAFLDRETAKIDALVEEQRKLIALLKEKRQALITQVVTKGLNPNVKMKDSGIEWLGEVPEHWEVIALKYQSDVELSNVDKHSTEGQAQIRLCNYTDVYYNEILTQYCDFMLATASDEQIKRLQLLDGDVVITKDSEDPSDIGVPTLVRNPPSDLVCGYHLAILRPALIRGDYLAEYLRSDSVKAYFETESRGMTRYAIGRRSISNCPVCVPSLDEQEAIATYLSRTKSAIDSMKKAVKCAIDLFQERRSALISAAVTGKIDVRDLIDHEDAT